MENQPDILFDQMTGRSESEGMESDLSIRERVHRFLGAQMELDRAQIAQSRGANMRELEDIEQAVSVLDDSSRYWAASVSQEELDLALQANAINADEYEAIKDRKSADLKDEVDQIAKDFDLDLDFDDRMISRNQNKESSS